MNLSDFVDCCLPFLFPLRKECPPNEYSLGLFSVYGTQYLYLYDNILTGNYTCPDSIERCWISCDSLTNNFTDACRSLGLFYEERKKVHDDERVLS